eukprot:NODE_1718_length_1427_cov_49.880261_g1550_i0.p1 GENE.NODE_1718_length_1427_cov_49.880261_g1550_i0~~NODE_1718_length_1427_cov_49.880261_g1550_i0.p1  ORF type:complete len:397 (+),score=51.75 NODE_1718_length_1427_cov_49.880261_g1550_i0:77-1267(+)
MSYYEPSMSVTQYPQTGAMMVPYAQGAVAPAPAPAPVYMPPTTSLVPYQELSYPSYASSGPVVQYQAPTQSWLYSGETDPAMLAFQGHKGPKPQPAPRIEMYRGSLMRPLMDEAYLTAHLSHQAAVSQFPSPGESLQLDSSAGRSDVLSVLGVSMDTAECGWRILGDGQTNFVIFRGSPDWQFPLNSTALSELYLGTSTTMHVHSQLLQIASLQAGPIINHLNAQPKSRIVLAGHGNGGALALIFFFIMQRAGFSRHNVTVYTFGAPFVGTGNHQGITRQPLPRHFMTNIHNFVNETDIVPLLLGNKDTSSVDRIIGKSSNPYKLSGVRAGDLRMYRPIGKFYMLSRNSTLVDVPENKITTLLKASQDAGGSLQQRVIAHLPDQYVATLRRIAHNN